MAEVRSIAFRWQFCDGYDEQSADEVRAWEGVHGDLCLAVAHRASCGRWRLGGGDLWSPEGADMDLLFGWARAAIEHIAQANGARLVEAICRCDSAAECD